MNNSDNNKHGMSLIVKTATRLSAGLILLYGIYLVSRSHVSPGGGFTGGLIIALSFVNFILAYGKEVTLEKLPKVVMAFFEKDGALLFFGIALLAFTGGYFFLNFITKGQPFKLWSVGTISLFNLAVSLKVGAGIFSILAALVLLKFESEQKK